MTLRCLASKTNTRSDRRLVALDANITPLMPFPLAARLSVFWKSVDTPIEIPFSHALAARPTGSREFGMCED